VLWDLDEIADLLGCFGLTAKRAMGCLGAGSFHTRLCARCEWSLMVTRDGSAVHPEQNVHECKAFSFLLPSPVSARCTSGLFRARNTKSFARRVILGFIRRMVIAITTDSKLCALIAHYATGHRLSADAVAQLGKGQGFAPPRCIPSLVPQAAAKTVPVSAPFGFRGVVSFRSWQVLP